ncbi:MAG: ABC transporter substrate-binding protein [Oscillospiraceae bacterium]|nr:ABC transporter substrate-binding protein [Oscillospiraceae bacterium]
MLSKSKKIVGLLLSVALMVALLAGCVGEEAAEPVVQVGTWRTAQTITPFYYDEFLDAQIEVLPFTNPGDQLTALLAGSLDMTGTTLVTAIMALARNEPIVMVTSLCMKCSALVVGSDSGIYAIEDLRGKTIAYVPGTMHHLLLLSVLEQAGLTADDVELIRIDFFDMGLALRQGTIDAFLSGEPFPSAAVLEGFGRILLYPYFEEEMGTINAGMITTRYMVENNPELIQKLVNAHVDATRYLNANTETWIEAAAAFGTDIDVVRYSMDNILLSYDIDEVFLANTRNLAQRMYDLDMIPHVPDVDALFNLDFLQGLYN